MAFSFLRLGVVCAVIDARGKLLLSKRGDLRLWGLPGGRLDSGELLAQAAEREVMEETGVTASVVRPMGLYYFHGWGRVNILFLAKPTGGQLLQQTSEAVDNAYFDSDNIPEDLFGKDMISDVLAGRQALFTIKTSLLRHYYLRLRFGIRWILNYLSARREPKYSQFDVWIVTVLWDKTHTRVLTSLADRVATLPRKLCDGDEPPWVVARELCGNLTINDGFRWAGMWQHQSQDVIELIFEASVDDLQAETQGSWVIARNNGLTGLDRTYVETLNKQQHDDRIWCITEQQESMDSVVWK